MEAITLPSMTVPDIPAASGPALRRLAAGSLEALLNANGSLRLLRRGALVLNLFPGSESEGGPANLVLRRHRADGGLDALPLCGPASPLRWCESGGRLWREALIGADDGGAAGTSWPSLRLRLELVLADAAPAWFWHLAIDHLGGGPCTLDLVLLQDIGLAPWDALRLNEAYVSQYIDHQPLAHARQGWLVASRQNAAVAGRHPWLLHGSLGHAVGFATDALQLTGPSRRGGVTPAALPAHLPNRRLQHEHSLVALQDAAFSLAPGASVRRGFFGVLEPDHPWPSGAADLARVARVLALPEAAWQPAAATAAGTPHNTAPEAQAAGLLCRAPLLAAEAIDEATLQRHCPGPWRQVERDEAGVLQSFFAAQAMHVVLPAKDQAVLRPHGHLLRSGGHWVPDETAVASTVWMAGVFHSSLTQGHASANRLLSTQRGYLGLARGHGLRGLVDFGDGWQLLQLPSAWCVQPQQATWIYRARGREVVVSAIASPGPAQVLLQLRCGGGAPPRLLLVHHIALDGDDGLNDRPPQWQHSQPGTRLQVQPAAGTAMARRFPGGGLHVEATQGAWACAAGDELLHDDGRPRGQPHLCLLFEGQAAIDLVYTAELTAGAGTSPPAVAAAGSPQDAHALALLPPAAAPTSAALDQLAEFMPWLAHNALVHYLSPRGLEQFSGGGWGTRDVCQGPVEWLQAVGRHDVVRDLLCRVFSAQNADGDWPQWFMFYARDAQVRAGDSHGDIVYWPLVALADHLAATGDAALLDEALPFHAPAGARAERAPLRDHVERAFAVIAQRRIAGTELAAYGHGDWNDALQPADPAMREHLCSAWTVTLHHRMLKAWAAAWLRLGRPEEAAAMQARADAVLDDFQRFLMPDGVLAGYASFDDPAAVRHLLHPRDNQTGIHYSALAMVHAIADELFTPEQAAAHLALIRQHLLGPDGLRLFDRPLAYRGGPMRLFQRGESASYFGREIGLMYMHAHLRWAEALAQLGRGDELLQALRLANPIGLRALVPSAAPRQANCYYSSSDAAFADRYEASDHYERIARGEVALEGGWRIYSSGAGIAYRLVLQRLLGLAQQAHQLVIDPVLPPALDGLQAELRLYGHALRVHYRVGPLGHGVSAAALNGQALPLMPGHNRYRRPGGAVALDALQAAWRAGGNTLHITIG